MDLPWLRILRLMANLANKENPCCGKQPDPLVGKNTSMPCQPCIARCGGAAAAAGLLHLGRHVGGTVSMIVSGLLGAFVSSSVIASDALLATNQSEAPRRAWALSLRWENDTFGGTDRFYTDGVALALSHTGPSWMDPVADWLPWGEGRRTVGYDIAQGMFTPSDKDLNPPDPKDRPYAGILALGLALHIEKKVSYHGLKFITGVVGPGSLAKDTQNAVHDLIGNNKSQGWDYQLENEPIFNLAYEYRHRFPLIGDRQHWSAEAIPLLGGWLGNVIIQAQGGGLVRFGYNMPDDFGPTLVRGMGHMPPPRREAADPPKSDWGFSFFGGGMANLVLRDITLDGNTFRDSPSVDKEFFVPMAGVGMTVGNRRFQASFAYIFWGKEFEGQAEYSKFGSIGLSYFF